MSRWAGKVLFFVVAIEELLFVEAALLLIRVAIVGFVDCVAGLLFAVAIGLAGTGLDDCFVIGCGGGAMSLRDIFLREGWLELGFVYAKRERSGGDGWTLFSFCCCPT